MVFFNIVTTISLIALMLVIGGSGGRAFGQTDIATINSSGTEDQPLISLDGKQLCFLYSPLDFRWFQKLPPLRRLINFKTGNLKTIGPYRAGFTEHDFRKRKIMFRGYCSRKVDGRWTQPTLASHELIPRDKGIYAKFIYVNNGHTVYVEASGIEIGGEKIKGKGDLVVFQKQSDGTWKGPSIVSDHFNTRHMEQDFYVTDDGKTLIFRSDRPGTLGGGDIFISHYKNGAWSKPANLGMPINTKEAHEAPGWLSPDRQRLYFIRAYPQRNNLEKTGIYFSQLVNDRWETPRKLAVGVKSRHIFAPSLTRDEKTLYFEVLPPGENNYQIYISHKLSDGSWTKGVPVD